MREEAASWSNGILRWAASRCVLLVQRTSSYSSFSQRTLPSQGGPIWSLSPNPASTILALGCEDGAVRLVSLLYDEVNHLRRLDRVKSRILSITWGPPVPRQTQASTANADSESDDSDENWSDSWLVTGCSDSNLRKWDFSSGRALERMGADKIRGERTLVWAVGVLGYAITVGVTADEDCSHPYVSSDGTIVSGDSMGIVKFWDSNTCTQLQSFQGHAADVLCLTVGPVSASQSTIASS